MISENMISIELEQEVCSLLNDGKSIKEISKVTGVSEETARTIKRQPTLRNLKRQQAFRVNVDRAMSKTCKCPTCGYRVTAWPCLHCNPSSAALSSGPLKQEDEGTVVMNGIQIRGRVIMPGIKKIVLLARLARNLIEMQKNNLLDSSVLVGHLVNDAKAALAVTEEEEKNGKRISGAEEGAC